MPRDWIDSPEYDRWRTDPEWRSPEEREMDKMIDAYEGMDDWYERYVVTNFDRRPYKPGDEVKWLGKDNEQFKGVVIGATEAAAWDGPLWVILKGTEVVEVDQPALMQGWEVPTEQPVVVPETPKEVPPYYDDDIPF